MDRLDYISLHLFLLDLQNLGDLVVTHNLDVLATAAQHPRNGLDLDPPLELLLSYSSLLQGLLVQLPVLIEVPQQQSFEVGVKPVLGEGRLVEEGDGFFGDFG